MAAIWTVDIADEVLGKRIDLTLKVLAGVCTLATVIVLVVGKASERDAAPPQAAVEASHPQGSVTAERRILDEAASVRAYLSNLEARLHECGASRSRFVNLSGEVLCPDGKPLLLQNFQWTRRDRRYDAPVLVREPIDLMSAHERFTRYVLLGDPGSGKTTCLQYLALELIEKRRAGNAEVLPLFVSLSGWDDRRQTALEFLRVSFSELAGGTSVLAADFEGLLARGELVVLLDGLNEMPGRRYFRDEKQDEPTTQSDLLAGVTSGAAFRTMQDPRERSLRELAGSRAVRTHFVVSCRTHEFFGSPEWEQVFVLPMDEGQIREFARNYVGDEGVTELASAFDRNPSLKDMAANPFFLCRMLELDLGDLASTRNRGQFLEHLYDALLQREGASSERTRISRAVGRLAFRMLERDLIGSQVSVSEAGLAERDALRVALGTGLLVRREGEAIAFYHQIVQEFLAALALRDRHIRCSVDQLLYHEKWSEPIALWHDTDEGGALSARLIRALALRNRPWRRPYSLPAGFGCAAFLVRNAYSFLVCSLLLDGLSGGGSLIRLVSRYPLQSLLVAIAAPTCLRYALLCFSYHPVAIGNAAYVLGRVRDPIAIPHLVDAFARVARNDEARTKVARAVAEFGQVALPSLLAGLASPDCNVQLGCIEALGWTEDELAVEPLLGVLGGGEARLVPPVVQALARIGDPRAGPAIANAFRLADETASWRAVAQYHPLSRALKEFRNFDEQLLTSLTDAAQRSQPPLCRRLAIESIACYGRPEGLPVLLSIAEDESEAQDARQAATKGLALVSAEGVVDALVMLHDQDGGLGRAPVEALESVRRREALPELRRALGHKDREVRHAAARALAAVGDPGCVDALVPLCHDTDSGVREEAARALASTATLAAVASLRGLCRDEEQNVRLAALESIDFAFPEQARSWFIDLCQDQGYPERARVVDLLGYHRFADAREALRALCADVDPLIRARAVDGLRRLDESLARELRHVSVRAEGPWYWRALQVAGKWLSVPDLVRLRRQEGLHGCPGPEAWVSVLRRVTSDSELKRKFRRLNLLFAGLMAGLQVSLGTLAAIGLWGATWGAEGLWRAKWPALGLVLAGLALSMQPVSRRLQGPGLRTAGCLVRALALGALAVAAAGLAVRYWFVSLSLLAATCLVAGCAARRWWQRHWRHLLTGGGS